MNELQTEFVPYELAVKLKALGFDEPCIYYVDKNNNSYIYNFQTHPDEFIEWCGVNVIPTPTFSQCFRWFREKYNLHPYIITLKGEWIVIGIIRCSDAEKITGSFDTNFNTLEEAELACLEKLIEIVESKLE